MEGEWGGGGGGGGGVIMICPCHVHRHSPCCWSAPGVSEAAR